MADEQLKVVFVASGQADLAKSYDMIAAAAERASRETGKFASGPNQNLARLYGQRSAASASGNGLAVKDIDLAIGRANKQIAAQVPKSAASRAMEVLKSSRIEMGGEVMRLMPLLGRLATALGPEVAAVIAVIGAEVMLASAFFELEKKVSETANEFSRLQFALGSSNQTTAQVQTLGGAIGLSPQAMAGLSQSLQDRISSDPMAMGIASKGGFTNLPRPFGRVDEGSNLLKAIEYLRSLQGDDRIRTARQLGIEQALPMTMLSNSTMDRLHTDADTHARIFNPGMQQDAAEFQAALSRVEQAFSNLMAAVGQPGMNLITSFLNDLAEGLNQLASFISANENKFRILFDIGMIDSPMGGYAIKDLWKAVNGDDKNDALKDNTKATEDNTRAMMPGMYGGGDRARGAIPGQWTNNGPGVDHMVQSGLQLGAF